MFSSYIVEFHIEHLSIYAATDIAKRRFGTPCLFPMLLYADPNS